LIEVFARVKEHIGFLSQLRLSSSMLFNLVQGKRESLSPLKLLLIAGISCRTTTVDYATLEFPKIVHGILSCFKYSCRLSENIKIVHDFYYWMLLDAVPSIQHVTTVHSMVT
jgi:hypothetical protein